MPRFSVTLPDEQGELIEDLAGEEGPAASKSEAVRMLITDAQRVDELETENDRLRREKQALINQRDENRELVEYVEGERELQKMERERRNAPLWRRIEWFVFGR